MPFGLGATPLTYNQNQIKPSVALIIRWYFWSSICDRHYTWDSSENNYRH